MTHTDAILTLCLLAFMSCVSGGFIAYWWLNRRYVLPMQRDHIATLRDMVDALQDRVDEPRECPCEIPDSRMILPEDLKDTEEDEPPEPWSEQQEPRLMMPVLPAYICMQFDSSGNAINFIVCKSQKTE